jgi:NAD-dependent DNA ligase
VAIKGIEKKSAQAFVDHIPEFLEFMKECGLESKLTVQKKSLSIETGHTLYGKTIVFTGLRDKVLEERLKTVGAKIGSGVSKNTFVVLAIDTTGKTEEAKKNGIPIMTPAEFTDKYM